MTRPRARRRGQSRPADDWDADAEWEGELAYRVLSDQGAFDVEEIDLPATEVEAEAEPIRRSSSSQQVLADETTRER